MADTNLSSHALLTMMSRCLSGHWHIEPQWLFYHSDLMLRADQGEDLSGKWPKMQSLVQSTADGIVQAAAAGSSGSVGKSQAFGVINVTGPIYKYGYNSSKMLVGMLGQMASDDRVGGIKLLMDSPGGMIHGTREVYELIANFPKPVLAVVDGYLASAAYYQVAGATQIVATQPNDQIGSIGTFSTYYDFSEFYKSVGIDIYEIYATDSPEKNESFRQLMESKGEKRDLAQAQVDAYNKLFLSDVKTGRGDKLTGKGHNPLAGRLFQPTQAKENGLIDDLISGKDSYALLADMVATSKQSSIQMDFKSFMGSLSNLITSAQKELGTESGEQQQQLTDKPTAEQLQQQLDAANKQIGTLTTERDNATTQVTNLTTERDSLKAKVDEYGSQPGAMGTKNQKEKDDVQTDGEQDWYAKVSGLEHNVDADAMFGKK